MNYLKKLILGASILTAFVCTASLASAATFNDVYYTSGSFAFSIDMFHGGNWGTVDLTTRINVYDANDNCVASFNHEAIMESTWGSDDVSWDGDITGYSSSIRYDEGNIWATIELPPGSYRVEVELDDNGQASYYYSQDWGSHKDEHGLTSDRVAIDFHAYY